jgi:hypothetical protein
MPTTDQHLTQARFNQTALAENARPDWQVTIRFYMALHLVEAVFARYHVHPTSHEEWSRFIDEKRFGFSFMARTGYAYLLRAAHTARYTCPTPLKMQQLEQASLEWLEDISNDVQRILAT